MTTTHEESDAQRLINSGQRIELKKLGHVDVCELCLEDVLLLSQELGIVLNSLQTSGSDDGIEVIIHLLKQEATAMAVRKLAAATIGKAPEDFERMPLTDWLRWANAFKEVSDWEELRELFTQLVPREIVEEIGTSLSPEPSAALSTLSQKSTAGQKKRS